MLRSCRRAWRHRDSVQPTAPGVFDWGTKTITRMYSAAGYTPPGTEPDITKQLDALEAQIAAATSPAEAAALAQQRSGFVGQSGSRALLSEIVVVAGLPAKVATVAGIGTRLEADKPLATLGAGPVVLAATMPSPAAQVLSVGATGEVTGSGSRGERVEITWITPDGADSSRISMKVLTGSFKIGTTHVVVVDNPQAAKAESTLVPVAAVVIRGGRSYVYRRDGAVFREVEVTVTGSTVGPMRSSSCRATAHSSRGSMRRLASSSLLELRGVGRGYGTGTPALDEINLAIDQNETVRHGREVREREEHAAEHPRVARCTR